MTTIVDLIKHEEGFRSRPYLCSEGFPTVGYGFKLSSRKLLHADYCKSIYDFELPQVAANAWLHCLLGDIVSAMHANPVTAPAIKQFADESIADYFSHPRAAVLISMAYQMGVEGLAGFKNTLKYVANGEFDKAASGMLKSKWATQTPARARRHAEQMKTGMWCSEYAR